MRLGALRGLSRTLCVQRYRVVGQRAEHLGLHRDRLPLAARLEDRKVRYLDARAADRALGSRYRPAMPRNASVAAAQYAGPALVLSFIIAAAGCALAGLCYAEFAAATPVSGSAYSYTYATLGEAMAWFVGWFVGWNLILEYLFAVATVSVGWSAYVSSLLAQFGIHIPSALSNAPFVQAAPDSFSVVRSGAILNVPAVLIVVALAIVCYVGAIFWEMTTDSGCASTCAGLLRASGSWITRQEFGSTKVTCSRNSRSPTLTVIHSGTT